MKASSAILPALAVKAIRKAKIALSKKGVRCVDERQSDPDGIGQHPVRVNTGKSIYGRPRCAVSLLQGMGQYLRHMDNSMRSSRFL